MSASRHGSVALLCGAALLLVLGVATGILARARVQEAHSRAVRLAAGRRAVLLARSALLEARVGLVATQLSPATPPSGPEPLFMALHLGALQPPVPPIELAPTLTRKALAARGVPGRVGPVTVRFFPVDGTGPMNLRGHIQLSARASLELGTATLVREVTEVLACAAESAPAMAAEEGLPPPEWARAPGHVLRMDSVAVASAVLRQGDLP